MTALREAGAWQALQSHHREIGDIHLRDLFAGDPGRGERLAADGAGLHLDYSKNRVTDETLGLLGELAAERGVAERRDAMFAGKRINVSEDRAREWIEAGEVLARSPGDEDTRSEDS